MLRLKKQRQKAGKTKRIKKKKKFQKIPKRLRKKAGKQPLKPPRIRQENLGKRIIKITLKIIARIKRKIPRKQKIIPKN